MFEKFSKHLSVIFSFKLREVKLVKCCIPSLSIKKLFSNDNFVNLIKFCSPLFEILKVQDKSSSVKFTKFNIPSSEIYSLLSNQSFSNLVRCLMPIMSRRHK